MTAPQPNSGRMRRSVASFSGSEHMTAAPLLVVNDLKKIYTRGLLDRTPTFRLEADFTIPEPTVVGVMGPNGSGKTTLFELITGSNQPTSGTVLAAGQDIHRVRYRERSRL